MCYFCPCTDDCIKPVGRVNCVCSFESCSCSGLTRFTSYTVYVSGSLVCFFFRMSLLRSCFHCTIGLNLSPFAFASTITALVSIFISFRTYFIRCTCVPTFETLMLTNSLRSLSLLLARSLAIARIIAIITATIKTKTH